MSIYAIGAVCRDLVDGQYVPGSGVLYGGAALLAQGQHINVITKCNGRDLPMFDSIIRHPLTRTFSAKGANKPTTEFENIYIDGTSNRVSVVHARTTEFTKDEIKSSVEEDEDRIFIVTPLAGEFPAELLPFLRSDVAAKRIAVDVQGFTRHVNESNGTVEITDWVEKEKYLSQIDALKIDNKEALVLVGTDDILEASRVLLKMGVRDLIVATCTEGVLFTRRKQQTQNLDQNTDQTSKAEPNQIKNDLQSDFSQSDDEYQYEWRKWGPPLTPESRTGRGDTTFFSAVSLIYANSTDLKEAATWTAKLVEAKMQHKGELLTQDVAKVKESILIRK
ncbi:MAG: putative carbohydrate kinase [Streblomastix strix]|uniref:Putative carbohydrate kinase n=1 Tax=Streblomastix strix TaxID=222440 RepID=A0A5J4X6M6_9EUKA|nr:MAG: putative carbohydrate kinase [Streblomastix strix]